MRKKDSIVYGSGVNDLVECCKENGKDIKSYKTWKQMLERCYSHHIHMNQKTYIICTVHDDWRYFSNFKKWFDENYIEDTALDKDILVRGNKEYSKETCCFVPQQINSLLTKSEARRGPYPIGITFHKRIGKLQVRCHDGYGKLIHLGYFNDVNEAFEKYKECKERVIKEVALKAFADNKITERVKDALMAYEVLITD